MKKTVCFLFSSLVLLFACNKSANTPDGNPIIITNPPDTAYLRKTETNFYYDATGVTIVDSSLTKWVYDDKRRIISSVLFDYQNQYKDSNTYSYTSNQSISNQITYLNMGVIVSTYSIDYLNSGGKTDSVVSNGVSNGKNYQTTTLVHYNSNGNDTLDETYNGTSGSKNLAATIRKYYSNNSLDSSSEFASSGIKVYTGIYSNGNIASDSEYTNGSISSTHSYICNDILSGGFYDYVGNKTLLTSVTETFFQPFVSSSTETLLYTYDASNRVSTLTRTKSNIMYEKESYTYY